MKLFSIPIFILLSVTIVSCQKQLDPEPDAARVTIGITLPKDAISPFGEERATKAPSGSMTPTAPGTGNATEESVIRRVTIYVFRAENRDSFLPLDAYADYYEPTNKGFGTVGEIDLSQFTVATTPGERDIYVVLNLPGGYGESVTATGFKIRSFADLQIIKIPLASQYGYDHSSAENPEIPQHQFGAGGFDARSNPSYRGLTMCGHYIGLTVTKDASVEIATISRLVSSINFGMWNDDPPTSQFFTDKMFLMNVSGESYIVPHRPASDLVADQSINTKEYLNTANYVTDYYTEQPYNCGSYRVRTIEWNGCIEDWGDKVNLGAPQEKPDQAGKPNLYSMGGKYDHTWGTLSGTDYGSYDIAAATNAVPPYMFFGGTQVIVQQDSYRDNGYPTENKPIKLNSTDGEQFAAWSKIFYVFPNPNNQIEGKSYPTCAVVSTVKSNSAGSGDAIPWNPANLRYYTAVVNKDGTKKYIHRNKKYWINIQINNTEGEEKGSANPWSGWTP